MAAIMFVSLPLVILPVYMYVALGLHFMRTMVSMLIMAFLACKFEFNVIGFGAREAGRIMHYGILMCPNGQSQLYSLILGLWILIPLYFAFPRYFSRCASEL